MRIGKFDKRVVFSLGLVVVVLLTNAALDYRNTRQLNEDAGWVAHSRAILESLDNLLSTMLDAETGLRGYLITGNRLLASIVESSDDANALLPGTGGRIWAVGEPGKGATFTFTIPARRSP